MAKITLSKVRAGSIRHTMLKTFIENVDKPQDEVVAALVAAGLKNENEGRRWYTWLHENCEQDNGEPLGTAPSFPRRTRAAKADAAPVATAEAGSAETPSPDMETDDAAAALLAEAGEAIDSVKTEVAAA